MRRFPKLGNRAPRLAPRFTRNQKGAHRKLRPWQLRHAARSMRQIAVRDRISHGGARD